MIDQRLALILALVPLLLGGPAHAATPLDTVVMGESIDDIVSLDPAEVYEFSGAEVVGNVYDRLIEGDPHDPAKIRPGLATAWQVDASGRVFTLKLRQGARFASGAPVTAGDAAFSLQRAVILDKSPALVLRQLGLTGDNVAARIRARDDGTLVIETAQPVAPSLVYFCLTASVASIVERREVLAHEEEGDLGNDWLASHSAGSGPYRLRLWRPSERYVLDANPDYWGGAPANRHVFVRHVKEAAMQRLMLLRGDIDYARNLDKDQLDAVARDPAIRIDRGAQGLLTYLAFNQRNPYLHRAQVIAALKYLIDYDGIAHSLLGATHVVHEAFEPQGYLGAIDDRPYRYDPGRAKALLASAGLNAGFAVTIDVRNASPWTEVAQALQAGFAAGGVVLTIIPGDGKQVLTKYRARHHDIFLGEWGTDYPDPHSNAEAFALNEDNSDAAQEKTPAWRNAWSDAAMNAQVKAAMAERDRDRRAALYRELQRAHQRVAPFAFMFQFVATAAHPAKIAGLVLGASPIETRYGGIAKH